MENKPYSSYGKTPNEICMDLARKAGHSEEEAGKCFGGELKCPGCLPHVIDIMRNKYGECKITKRNTEGDTTLECGGKNFLFTADGKFFKEIDL